MTILAIGRATFDLGYACEAYPAEDGKLSATQFWAGAGGSALNGAITARALGSDVRLLTLLGAGPFADAVRAELTRFDVRAEDFADPAQDLLPVSSIVLVPAHGTRTIVDQQPVQIPSRLPPEPFDLTGIKLVYCDGFLPEIAVPIARAARAAGIPTVLDGGSWKAWTADLMPLIDDAIVSARFVVPDQQGADILVAVQARGPQRVALTQGAGPIRWAADGATGEIAPPPVDALDTLGAGDIFHGAYCHFAARGAGFASALAQAAGIAADSCRFYGTRGWIAARTGPA